MSNDVTVKLKGDKTDLASALGDAESMIKNWGTAIKTVLVGVAAGFAAKKLFDFGSDMISAYSEAQQAETRLASVLKATGEAAGYSKEQLMAMSSQLEEQLAIGDDTIQNTFAIIATFKNIRGDHFKEATERAADMAEVLGGDLSSSAMQVSKALNDPTKGITALTRAGVSFTEQQKEQIQKMQEAGDMMGAQRIILDELASEFGGAATAQAGTFAGSLDKMSNRLGNVSEVIGELLIPYVEMLFPVFDVAITAVEGIADALLGSSDASEEFANSWSDYFVDSLKTGINTAIDVFSTLEFLWTNMGPIVLRTITDWELSIVGWLEEIKQAFTVTAPAYLDWYADNFFNIFKDISNFHHTVQKNMAHNVKEFFEGLWAYLSGGEGGFEFIALTEGFESSLSELPVIAERKITETEKQLQRDIANLDQMMGDSWNEIWRRNEELKMKAETGREKTELEVDMTADVKPFEEEVAKAEKKAKKKVEKEVTSKEPKQDQNQQSSALGAITALEQLSKDIESSKGALAEKTASFMTDAQENMMQPMMAAKREAVKKQKGVVDFTFEGDASSKHAPEKEAFVVDTGENAEATEGPIQPDFTPDAVSTTATALAAAFADMLPEGLGAAVTAPQDTLNAAAALGEKALSVVQNFQTKDIVAAVGDLIALIREQHPETIRALDNAGGVV